MDDLIRKPAKWMLHQGGWEKVALVLLIIVMPYLVFHNLEYNPRPWHDEGSYLSLAKTLVTDNVYAVHSSDGYQTFGAVQSVGPTVLLPIALSFKLLGVGLLQGRIVAGIFALLMLAVFYRCGLILFGRRAALIAIILLLASPAVGFFLYGRPAFGEIPALGLLLAGWLAWAGAVRSGRRWLHSIAGLLIGAAMVTKSQYVIVGAATIALLVILDLVYFRQGLFGGLLVVGLVAFGCVAAWWLWQLAYFGQGTFQENAAKMRQLASSTTGFHLHTTIEAVKSLVGPVTGSFYFFWGFLGLIYVGFVCTHRNKDAVILSFLWLFACLWLGYYTFWIIPWSRYLIPAAAITALFVGKLCSDLLGALAEFYQELWRAVRHPRSARLSPTALVSLGTLVSLLTLALLTGYQLQRTIRLDVLDRNGNEAALVVSPPQFSSPHDMAAFLNAKVPKDAVIDTWERELSVLTDHQYHYPDQSLLAQTDVFIYHGGAKDYKLGADYFERVRPRYVIVGWYARFNQIYDTDFLVEHGKPIASIGDGVWRYDVYQLDL